VDTTSGPYCKCSDGWSGIGCNYRGCFWNATSATPGCPGHAGCVSNQLGEQYCFCDSDWTGPNCSFVDNSCANKDCSKYAKTMCVNGRCSCLPGFVQVIRSSGSKRTGSPTDAYQAACIAAQPITCANITCPGNQVCVASDPSNIGVAIKPYCACPVNVYGSRECRKPRCYNDTDCQVSLLNSRCVIDTQSDVASYCACAPHWTGDQCDQPIGPANCTGLNADYDNEAICKCKPSYTGSNCTTPNVNCISLTVVFKPNATTPPADVVRTTICSEIIVTDRLVIDVDGPRNASGVYYYNLRICNDDNVDCNKASSDFQNQTANGNTGNLAIESVNTGSNNVASTTTTATGTNSDAVSAGISHLLAVAVVTFFVLVA